MSARTQTRESERCWKFAILICHQYPRFINKASQRHGLAWYEKQDEAFQTRIRMLACFTANLQKGDWRQLLPGACRGARDDRIIFDAIADMLIAPLLGERMRQTVMRSSLKDIAASMRGGHF